MRPFRLAWVAVLMATPALAWPAAPPPPRVEGYELVCKLLNGRAYAEPTANDVERRFNVAGADLGYSAAGSDRVWIFFGDTNGYRHHWARNGPDSVAYVGASADALAADPRLLCDGLKFVSRPRRPRRAGIRADFEPARMIAPPGEPLAGFVRNPVDARHPGMPGSFEVPSGAFFHDGAAYVLYTGGPASRHMSSSYLAKWSSPDPAGPPRYRILYALDDLDRPRMGGHFINNAPVADDGWIFLFGSGRYRHSAVYLGRKRMDELERPGGWSYRTSSGGWSTEASQASPIAEEDSVGELSARHFARAGLWLLMYARRGEVVVRSALRPEGPWSEAAKVHSMEDAGFRDRFCCDPKSCAGGRIIHCEKAGAYAPALLPRIAEPRKDGSFEIDYLLSTWAPYNAVLMRARLSPRSSRGEP